jgi:hypothetical protein
VSPPVFDGWVPREVHQTYAVDPDDPEGEPVYTGYVVVTRESEWSETTRARAVALVEHEESIDGATGLPKDEAYRKQGFMVHRVTNYADKAIQAKKRADREAPRERPEARVGRRPALRRSAGETH